MLSMFLKYGRSFASSEEVLATSDHCRNDLFQFSTDIRSKFGIGTIYLHDFLGLKARKKAVGKTPFPAGIWIVTKK